MAQSPFFPRYEPQQTAGASKERMPHVLNLNAQERRQRSFIHRGRSHSTRTRPHRLFAAPGMPALCFPAVMQSLGRTSRR